MGIFNQQLENPGFKAHVVWTLGKNEMRASNENLESPAALVSFLQH
jgi:hypothetical protein